MDTREHTKKLANDIRTKIYGKEVREALATGIEESGNTSQEARDITENLLDGSYDSGLLNTEIEQRMNNLYSTKGVAMDELYTEKDTALTNLYENEKTELDNLQADYANRAETLETIYAPRLTSAEQDITNNHQEVTAQLAHKVGYGVKAEPEDLSATTLGLLTGEGGPIELMSVPQNFSVDSQKINPENRPDLLIREAVTEGYYLANGTPTANNSLGYSDYIEVLPNKEYVAFFGSVDGQLIAMAGSFYDENMNRTGNIPLPTSAIQTITIPSNVRFARINLRLSMIDEWFFKPEESMKYSIQWLENQTQNYAEKSVTTNKLADDVLDLMNEPVIIPENPTQWVDKRINFLGDSITQGAFMGDGVRYTEIIKNELSLSVANNYGASGSKIADVENDTVASFTERYLNMDDNADLVFVFGGTNDYGHTQANSGSSVPFGSFEDRTDGTFYGALHVLYKGLVEKYPGIPIVIITPTHRRAPSGKTGDDYVVNEDTNKNLRDYVRAIREVAEFYGLPVLDLFKDFYFNPNIQIIKDTYFPDGLHPNGIGHQKLADTIINYMRRL